MFKNKHADGKNNRCGKQIAALRKQWPTKMSQRILAEKLQERGLDVDKNAIQRMESGDRFVTDIELVEISRFFDVSVNKILFPPDEEPDISQN